MLEPLKLFRDSDRLTAFRRSRLEFPFELGDVAPYDVDYGSIRAREDAGHGLLEDHLVRECRKEGWKRPRALVSPDVAFRLTEKEGDFALAQTSPLSMRPEIVPNNVVIHCLVDGGFAVQSTLISL